MQIFFLKQKISINISNMTVQSSKRYPGNLLSAFHNQRILAYIILHRILYCSLKQLDPHTYHLERRKLKRYANLIANVCQIQLSHKIYLKLLTITLGKYNLCNWRNWICYFVFLDQTRKRLRMALRINTHQTKKT